METFRDRVRKKELARANEILTEHRQGLKRINGLIGYGAELSVMRITERLARKSYHVPKPCLCFESRRAQTRIFFILSNKLTVEVRDDIKNKVRELLNISRAELPLLYFRTEKKARPKPAGSFGGQLILPIR